MIVIENPELEGSSVPCIVHYTDGKTERRTFCNTSSNVGLKCYRSKRRYYPLTSGIYNRIDRIVLMQRNKKNTVETIRANATRFLKLLDSRLWPDLRQKVTEILENLDKDYKEWENITDENKNTFSGWFWDKYHEEWLYHRNIFMTVNTAFGKRFGCGPELSRDIQKYLDGANSGFERASIRDTHDGKSKYLYYSNCYQYDNHFEIHRDQQRAFLSREFRGCGNGHYYLLLSPTHAIHYEDD